MDLGAAISVPTGKLTPIEPAEPQPKTIATVRSGVVPAEPAPVYEYSEERPEPPPLDPSYVPIQYNFIEYLAPQGIVLVSDTRLITTHTHAHERRWKNLGVGRGAFKTKFSTVFDGGADVRFKMCCIINDFFHYS